MIGLSLGLGLGIGKFGGAQAPGIYVLPASGARYFNVSSADATGITFETGYPVNWYVIESDGERIDKTPVPITTAPQGGTPGLNAVPLTHTDSKDATVYNYTANMYLATTLTITQSSPAVSIIKNPILAGLVSGGTWSEVIPSDIADEFIQANQIPSFDFSDGDNSQYIGFM
jgi:hypothetical protein